MAADQPIHVVIDTREQRPWFFDPKTVTVTRETLREGDYTVAGLEGRLVLERKSLGDAVQTVIQGWLRFKKELVRLSGYEIAAIVVEADLEDVANHRYESEATPASVIGKFNSVWIEHGIPVLFWGNHELAGYMAHRFLLQAWRKLS